MQSGLDFWYPDRFFIVFRFGLRELYLSFVAILVMLEKENQRCNMAVVMESNPENEWRDRRMLTGAIKKADKIWTDIWTGGITNVLH